MLITERQQAARDNWPKDQCPGRGRTHLSTETYSCPWCLPHEFYAGDK